MFPVYGSTTEPEAAPVSEPTPAPVEEAPVVAFEPYVSPEPVPAPAPEPAPEPVAAEPVPEPVVPPEIELTGEPQPLPEPAPEPTPEPVAAEPVSEPEAPAPEPVIDTDDDELMTGVEKVYSTAEAAEFFGKSNQWLYWGLRNNIFVDVNGNTIEPHRIGKGKRRRFTLPIIREIALACYRRGNLKEDELKAILRKILLAEHGEGAFDPAE